MPAHAVSDGLAGGRSVLLGGQALRRIGAGLALAALVILWLGRYTNVDLALADALYDHASRVFPLRHAWLTEAFSHGILKVGLTACAVGAVGLAVVRTIWPRGDAWSRLRLQIVGMTAVLVPLVTSMLKQASYAHCPWDLERYGGTQPYVRIFEALPFGSFPGHCLPGGHASTALWLVALAVFWLPHSPRKALAVAIAAGGFGFTIGWLQQLRGAHFLTHTLWSLWIAAAIVAALVALLQRRLAPSRPAAAVAHDAEELAA